MREHSVPLILIVVIAGGIFLNALHSEFIWDDNPVIVKNDHIRDLRNAFYFFTPEYWQVLYVEDRGMRGRVYRPLVELSFAVEYAVWGLNPLGWHITSLVWHALNCVLVYFFAHRIFADKRAATFCAVLFAAHPIHVEAVVWAKARSELLAFMLMLSSALLYLRYLDHSSRARRPDWLYLSSLVLFALALVSKASAIVLPPLLLLYVWRFVPRATRRGALGALLPFVGMVGAFFAFRSFTPTMAPTMQLDPYQHLLSVLGTVGTYLRLLLLPLGLCLHHRSPVAYSLWAPEPLIGLALSLVLLGAIGLAFRRSNIAFFALAWLLISIVPISNLKLLPRLIGEVRAYGPSMGFCLLLAALLHGRPSLSRGRSPIVPLDRMAIGLCAFIVAAYSGLTVARNVEWRDNFTLWQDTVIKNPGSLDAHRNMARIYMERGQREAALPHLRRAVKIYPEYTWALEQLARLCTEAGLDEEAIVAYEMLLRYHPDDAHAHLALAEQYFKGNRLVEAEDHLKAALRHHPESPGAHQRLGYVYVLQERYDEASAEFRRAAELGLDEAALHHALGTVSTSMGRNEAAVAEFRQALRAEPDRVQTWAAMAECYEKLGNAEEAVRCYNKCVELGGPLAEMAQSRLEQLRAHEQD